MFLRQEKRLQSSVQKEWLHSKFGQKFEVLGSFMLSRWLDRVLFFICSSHWINLFHIVSSLISNYYCRKSDKNCYFSFNFLQVRLDLSFEYVGLPVTPEPPQGKKFKCVTKVRLAARDM